ncbi:MarR family winged helix-turn-helix transcriptional regulator [Streptomyces brevispora]|uniref:MarR family winged helix-turn-helix transcriptional regulator n=1 Tax=Streptomyces brevispora TaxID=887462 RepID=A0ABZ1G0M0_9ACTN|nr:MarR family winged helix-turn-helix transcriptional regulator [Streptomyces brevispora]WSC12792.1 MarR family winged helix-turn-helix transcriptional regulator [Streptomyces brevispora]
MLASSASGPQNDHVASVLVAVLPTLNRVLERRMAQDFPHPTLPEGQLTLLRLVEERAGITVRDAADALLMKSNNVSALVSQLTDLGLLERRRDAVDKRVAHLHPTALAAERLAEARGLKEAHMARLLETLTDGEQDALGAACGALLALTRHFYAAD